MPLDPMVIINRAEEWQDVRRIRVPQNPGEPVVWETREGTLCSWHPILQESKVLFENMEDFGDDGFYRIASDVARDAVSHVAQRFELLNCPKTYLNNYPGIVQQVLEQRYPYFKTRGLSEAESRQADSE